MSDDLDARLRETLRRGSLPPAPASLHARLHALRDEPEGPRGRPMSRARLLIVPIAVAVLLGLAGVIGGAPGPSASHLASVPTVDPSQSSAASQEPRMVDGLPVMSVSEVLAARAAGGLRNQAVAVGGYWSNGSIGHSCVVPLSQPGILEIYCQDGEFGITELDEPVIVIDRHGNVTPPRGPTLTPYVPRDLAGLPELFSLPYINGQRYPPVPIVVVGHFDDPLAAECQPKSRQLCLDRLVVDRIAIFDPGAVPTPGISPTPSPFPSPAPSGLFDPTVCAGNVPYSLVGWTTTSELQLPFDREGHVWAVVTRDPVLLGGDGWYADPNGSTGRYRPWARRICIGEEDDFGAISYGLVPGSGYWEWEDGHRTPGDTP